MLARMRRNQNLHKLLVGMYNYADALEIVGQFIQKVNIELPFGPAIYIYIYLQEK